MTKFSKWKVPLPGGQARRNKLLGTTQHCCTPRGLMLAPSEIRLHRAGPDPLADELDHVQKPALGRWHEAQLDLTVQ